MTTWAHVRAGVVLDPRAADDETAYRGKFSAGQLAEWSGDAFKSVTDGTQHGATDNGNGTFTNPSGGPPARKTMDREEFEAWFVATFGADAKTAAQIKAAWPNG